jgi:hypothetical protein
MGAVDVGVAVSGIKGGVSVERFGPGIVSWETPVPYDRDEYRRTRRVSAIGLADDPHTSAGLLVNPLIEARPRASIL